MKSIKLFLTNQITVLLQVGSNNHLVSSRNVSRIDFHQNQIEQKRSPTILSPAEDQWIIISTN